MHPYFDANTFPWDRTDAPPFYDVLVELIDDPEEILLLYEQSGGKRSALDAKQPPGVLWHKTLGLLAEGDQLSALCARLKAIPRLKKKAAFHAAVDAVVDAKEQIERRVFAPNVLVLDREPLRDTLKQLVPAHGPLRVVLVRGPEKSGKTWAQHVFQGAALDHGAQPCYVYGGMVVDANDLIDELFATIGAPSPGSFDTTDNAAYGAVCRDLMRAVMERKQPLWIAIDDVRDFDDSIRELCDQLGARMRTPTYGKWFRLMLIHYPERTLPTAWRPEVWAVDDTTAHEITLSDVEAFLAELSAEAERGLHDDDVKRIAKEVMAHVDAPLPPGAPVVPRLQRLHDRLVQVVEAEP